MSWICWILASAVFLALYDLAKKASVRDNAVLPVLLCSTLFGCAAFLLGLWASGRFALVAGRVDIRLVGLAAVKSTVVHEGIDFLRSRAVWCAVAGMCFSALSAIWDKHVFRHDAGAPDDPQLVEAVQLLFQVGLVVVYGLLLAVRAAWCRLARTGGRTPSADFSWRWTIPLVGILLTAADWLYFHGIHEDGVLISVASLMRRFAVVITFVLGAKVFHETNLARKGLALAAILLGIVLLCLGA